MWSPKAKPDAFGSQYIPLKAVRARGAQALRGLQEKLSVASVRLGFLLAAQGK